MRRLEALGLPKGPIGLYRVSGNSMLPTYKPGDLLIGWRWFEPKAGQVVVAHTHQHYIVKRIKKIEGNKVWLEGDNNMASTDSRTTGLYSKSLIEALILFKISP